MSLSAAVREVVLNTQPYDRAWFIDQLRQVGTLRALWIPSFSDTTTATSLADPRTWTYDGTIAARVSHRGAGVLVSFNGTNQYATTPDTADMSFGDGANDSPFSIVSLANVTNTAANRTFLAKSDNGSNQEYIWYVDASTDALIALFFDQSAGVIAYRQANAAASMGALHLFGFSYDGGGGATAANGITLYEDAAVVASTANNNASYVAMEALAPNPSVGAIGTTTGFMSGAMGFEAVYAEELSLQQHRQIKVFVNSHFGLSL